MIGSLISPCQDIQSTEVGSSYLVVNKKQLRMEQMYRTWKEMK